MELRKKVFALEKQLLMERATRAPSASVGHPHEKQKDGDAEVTGHTGRMLQSNPIPGAHPGLGEIGDFNTAFSAFSQATDGKQ